jgi:tRNA pseudouridine38-40 synthase
VGKGKHSPDWLAEILQGRDRRLAAPTFSPDGLYLVDVDYAPGWKLPAFEPKLPFSPEQGLP